MNGAFGLQASIEDQYGNVVTSDSNTVTVAFANNPTGATLSGTLSVAASQGVATFSGLEINKTGTGYTLQVTSSGLSSAVSSAIDVTKTGKAIVAPSVPPGDHRARCVAGAAGFRQPRVPGQPGTQEAHSRDLIDDRVVSRSRSHRLPGKPVLISVG